jgi:hypothetical protein
MDVPGLKILFCGIMVSFAGFWLIRQNWWMGGAFLCLGIACALPGTATSRRRKLLQGTLVALAMLLTLVQVWLPLL